MERNLGLKLGGGDDYPQYPFAGDYTTKGCYKYPKIDKDSREPHKYSNMAFYGTGGTENEMKSTQLPNGQQRVPGYDCSMKNIVGA
jgi:hypothetical protein